MRANPDADPPDGLHDVRLASLHRLLAPKTDICHLQVPIRPDVRDPLVSQTIHSFPILPFLTLLRKKGAVFLHFLFEFIYESAYILVILPFPSFLRNCKIYKLMND